MISDLLVGKNYREKANIKGEEISKSLVLEKISRPNYSIEIISSKPINGGIEIYARAWTWDNKQIGFGKDGTVDIERFVIINPPILVPDDNGNIQQRWSDEILGKSGLIKLREDPREAMWQCLEDCILLKKQKSDNKKIIINKVGNTTTIVFPDAGTSTGGTVDGYSGGTGGAGSWSTVVGLATGNENTADTDVSQFGLFARERASDVTLRRGFYTFDIPDLTEQIIDSAMFSLHVISVRDNHTNSSRDIALVIATPASDDALTTADYDQVGSTEFAPRLSLTSDFTTGVYNDWILNAAGISNIGSGGIVGFATRSSWDIDDVGPTPDNNSGSGIETYFADDPGTTRSPKLTIESSVVSVFSPKVIFID